MADYYYHLEVYSCRKPHEVEAVGTKDHEVPMRPKWTFTHHAASVVDQSAGEADFLAAVEAAIPGAPSHISKIKKSGTGSLKAALDASATTTNDGTASSGPWSERVGKDVFAYRIGVSGTSASAAESNLTSHNLS